MGRLANTADAFHSVAVQAVLTLHRRGESLRTVPQNLVEFRGVATRPVAVNGLGLAAGVTETQAAAFETAFPILAETPDIYSAWKTLVQAANVIGKQVPDARLVALCQVYAISHILTFNVQHLVVGKWGEITYNLTMINVTLICYHCKSENIVRNGLTRKGKQRYKCYDCERTSRDLPQPAGYSTDEQERILRAYEERSSLRG